MIISDMEVSYIDHCGSDLSVVNAARVSFSKESDWEVEYHEKGIHADGVSSIRLSEKDAKLIRYLAKHKHFSPFNHSFISLRIKAPVFVARQLVKHKFMPWNEVSRRYVDDEVEVYMPDFWRSKAENVKQGSSEKPANVNTYGTGVCVKCGSDVPRKSAGPRGKWCSDACRASYRKEHDPDFRLHTAKYNAQKRNISFSLAPGDVEWVTHCPILGLELEYSSSLSDNDNSPSIDRIDSRKGYERGNVWVISSLANRMKNDADKDNLIKFAKGILLHFNGQIVPENGDIYSTCEHSVNHYYWLLNQGVCPEQARIILPQNMMTEWIWSGTLGAYCDMLRLRLDPHTQLETREVAQKVHAIIEPLFPVSVKELLSV
jgi:thymidylate synthase ThyX